ncbi:MAG TPA: hypothetical protein VGR53_10870 [Nitrososphaerales archaeon]|nr:hypothetical protein [Nitrososphaerales archaeon]
MGISTGRDNEGRRSKLPRYLRDYYSQIYSGSIKGNSVSILSRACERPVASGRAIRFEIPNKYLEELSGMKLVKGKLYLIRGRIESQFANEQTAWKFDVFRFVTPHLKLRIYLPKEYHDRVIPGETYKIVIESITESKVPKNPGGIFSLVRHGGKWSRLSIETPEPEAARTKITYNETVRSPGETKSPDAMLELWGRARQTKWIDWKVVAAWIDTEGYLYTREGRRRRYELVISQSEPEPLTEIQRFLHEQGIRHCSVKWVNDSHYTTGGTYVLKLKALEELDAVVAKTRPFLMVPIRKNQYQRYSERRREAPNLIKFVRAEGESEVPSKWIDWKVVAAWIDGEGNLTTRERGSNKIQRDYCLDISQKERAPLESIRSFLERDGIKAKVISEVNGTHSLQVTSVSDIDLIIKRTLPFIMTDNKRLQYEEYMTRRKRMPKRGPRPKPPLF